MLVIGDVHGQFQRYSRMIAREADYSLQLGDMGLNYRPLMAVDPARHKFFGGNHDNYDQYDRMPHALGNFGQTTFGVVEFFYVRGAFSIDWKFRTPHRDWWADEELREQQLEQAFALYVAAKPEIVITHDCPRSIARIIGKPEMLRAFDFDPENFTTRTSEALQRMLEAHQPERWIFGHFHLSWTGKVNGTQFQCLNELETTRV